MGLGSALGSIASSVIGGAGALAGGAISANNQLKMAELNYKHQKEFAQNGIRWKVSDAKAAGIHPLYALGASTSSYSPVSGYGGDNGIGEAAAQFGQGIGRAVEAGMTKEERQRENAKREMQETFDLALRQQELEAGRERISESRLRNKLLEQQILMQFAGSQKALLRGLGPAMPSKARPSSMSGQGDSPYMDKAIPQDGWLVDEKGRKVGIIPGDDMKSRTEDVLLFEWIPHLGSFWRDFKNRWTGREFAGHYWHSDKEEYLPYPPKKGRKFNAPVGKVRSRLHDFMY